MRYHLTHQNGCHQCINKQQKLVRMWRKGDPRALGCDHCVTKGVTTGENHSVEVPPKIKTELPQDPAILLLGVYLKKPKTLIRKDTCTPMVIAVLFTMAKML